MQTTERGRAFIATREGLRLLAYPDPATGGEPWTIGVGHTSAAGPPIVRPGLRITRADALDILQRDLAGFERAVSAAVRVALRPHEFDALVSLAFNIGGARFSSSSLVKRLNGGDRTGAADAFLSWTRAGGRILPGLQARRAQERRLFLSGDYGPLPPPAVASAPARFVSAPALSPVSGRDLPEPAGEVVMDSSKGFFASRTVWANLIGLAALGLGVAGVDTSRIDTGGLADAATQIVAGVSFVLSTLFRVQATKAIG